MNPQELKARTKTFGLRVVKLVRMLPPSEEARVLGQQLLRSATSVGAHYRAVCRGQSDRDFIYKLGRCIEEADESGYWLELLIAANIATAETATALAAESEELTRIFAASRETVRARLRSKRKKKE